MWSGGCARRSMTLAWELGLSRRSRFSGRPPRRKGLTASSPISRKDGVVIERGDVLHTDFGITAMRLNTDTQHMGYVLRPGETNAPAGILEALKNTNRLQELTLRMHPGRTG